MNGLWAMCDQLDEIQAPGDEMSALTNALIALGAVGGVGYALITHLQNRVPNPRARASGDGSGSGDSYSGTSSDIFSPGGWFSSDSSGSSTDSGSCSAGDSGSSGGDCGGGGGSGD